MSQQADNIVEVLCVISRLRAGGVQTFLVNSAEGLLRHGVRLNFAVDTVEEQRYDAQIKALGCRIFSVTGLTVSPLKHMRDLRRLVKAHPEFRIVHTHFNYANALPLLAVKGLGRVTISHAHSSYPASGWLSLAARGMARALNPLIVDERWGCSGDALRWLFGKRGARHGHVIANAIDCRRWAFKPEARKRLRTELGLSDDTWTWVHTGSMTYAKNHKFLIDLFAAYQRVNPKSHLILCGDGGLRGEIESQIDALGIRRKVTLAGVVDNCEEWLSAADAFVFPSRYEGFALSLIEAQCNGLTTTTTTTAVPSDARLDGVTAIDGYDTAEWIAAIERSRIGEKMPREAGPKLVVAAGFDLDMATARLAELYKSLIKK